MAIVTCNSLIAFFVSGPGAERDFAAERLRLREEMLRKYEGVSEQATAAIAPAAPLLPLIVKAGASASHAAPAVFTASSLLKAPKFVAPIPSIAAEKHAANYETSAMAGTWAAPCGAPGHTPSSPLPSHSTALPSLLHASPVELPVVPLARIF